MSLKNSTSTVNGVEIDNNGTVIVVGGTGTANSNYAHEIVATPNSG